MSRQGHDPETEPLLEESLDDLYEHAPCGYLSTLEDGRIVKVNETFLSWTGYARDELVGRRRFQDLLTPGGRIYHETHYAPLLSMQGSVREIAVQVRRADGSRMPVLVNSVLRRAEGSERAVVRTTVFDARDRRAYEEELLRARRREREARERVERLQRLTEALVATLDEAAIAAAALSAAMEPAGVTAVSVDVTEAGGSEPVTLAHRGTPGADAEDFPLVASGRTLGRLRVELAAAPAEPDRSFLLACARQCAQALERSRLHGETARSARRSALLAELAQGLEERRGYAARAGWVTELLVRELADEARVEAPGPDGPRTIVARAGTAGSHASELPLRADGSTLVVTGPRPFGAGELELLLEVAAHTALALENARLYEHEHRVADALQRSMLTRELPRDPRVSIAADYRPAVELMAVGGDWYDAFTLADGRLALVVGDVVGRGIEAASAMGQLRSATRALAVGAAGPGTLLARLDEFVEHLEIARFATLVYAEVDLDSGAVRYACAGHPPPVLASRDGEAHMLWDGRSPPLAAFPGFGRREEGAARLEPGGRLLMYTDGLVERRDRVLDEGLDLLVAAVADGAATPLADLVAELPRRLVRGDEARDDVCLMGVALR